MALERYSYEDYPYMSVEDYLQLEQSTSLVRYEYLDGVSGTYDGRRKSRSLADSC